MWTFFVVFNFVFPYHKLTDTAYIVAIYGINAEEKEDMCAYYLLTTTTLATDGSGTKETHWDPIEKTPDDEETNKVLAVEWTMKLFNNINKEESK